MLNIVPTCIPGSNCDCTIENDPRQRLEVAWGSAIKTPRTEASPIVSWALSIRALTSLACRSAIFTADDRRIASIALGDVQSSTVQSLSALGFGASCRTPAETSICAYVQWGHDFTEHLGESFACVLWDDPAGRLILVSGRTSGTTVRFICDRSLIDYWGVFHKVSRATRPNSTNDSESFAVRQAILAPPGCVRMLSLEMPKDELRRTPLSRASNVAPRSRRLTPSRNYHNYPRSARGR